MRKQALALLVGLCSVGVPTAAFAQVVNVEPIGAGNVQVTTPTGVYVGVPDAAGNYKILQPQAPRIPQAIAQPMTTITPNGLIVTSNPSGGYYEPSFTIRGTTNTSPSFTCAVGAPCMPSPIDTPYRSGSSAKLIPLSALYQQTQPSATKPPASEPPRYAIGTCDLFAPSELPFQPWVHSMKCGIP